VLTPRFDELLVLTVTMKALLRVALVSALLGILAALLPARQIAGLEPVSVLRKG
jgi:ABC-type lipoprotein release transport system permease subunit